MLTTKYRQKYSPLSDDVIRIKPTPATQAYYNSLGHPEWGTPTNITNFTGSPLSYDEWFRGETDNIRDRWNNCEHYCSKFEPMDVNGLYFLWSCPTGETPSRWWEGNGRVKYLINTVVDYMNPTVSGPVLFVPREDGGFVPPPPGIEALKLRSLNAMMPQVKSELSLLNFIYELKDFKSLPRTFSRIATTMEKVKSVAKAFNLAVHNRRSRLGRSFSATWGNTLREVFQGSADGYLQAQFNLKPLFSDIGGIYLAMTRVRKSIETLIARQGSLQRRHFTFKWIPYPSKPISVEDAWNDGFDHTFLTEGGEVLYAGTSDTLYVGSYIPGATATFHAEIEYRYHFTRLQSEYAQICGILDALGVNLNPAIIWNAIPWTFVVDWVIGVSQWLDQRKILTLEPTVNITRYLWSWSYKREIRRNIYGVNNRSGGFGPVVLPSVYQSIYRREVGLPDKSSLIMSGLSPKEISLGVALAITRKKRRYNRLR